jgi:hypothetical protein
MAQDSLVAETTCRSSCRSDSSARASRAGARIPEVHPHAHREQGIPQGKRRGAHVPHRRRSVDRAALLSACHPHDPACARAPDPECTDPPPPPAPGRLGAWAHVGAWAHGCAAPWPSSNYNALTRCTGALYESRGHSRGHEPKAAYSTLFGIKRALQTGFWHYRRALGFWWWGSSGSGRGHMLP